MRDPYFLLSRRKVFENLDRILEICDDVTYSWKTNPEVGNIVNENGFFVSVHSERELKGVPDKGKVWYFGFAWDQREIKRVIKQGIRCFVIDNKEDLEVLLNVIRKIRVKVSVLLRMKMKENTLFTGKHYVFGMESSLVKELLALLSKEEYVEKKGVHFHRKTQNVSEWNLVEEIKDSFGSSLQFVDIINIGGGLPANYKNTNTRFINYILKKLKEFKIFANRHNVKVWAEPGRFVAASAVKLVTFVRAVIDNTIFVNASIFNGALDTVVANIKLIVEGEVSEAEGSRYLIKGCTPDSCDIFRYSVYLKEKPKKGDKIVFLNAGAYNYQTDFCALKKVMTKVVDSFDDD